MQTTTTTTTTTQVCALFVAGASHSDDSEQKREMLNKSIDYTEYRYSRTYADYVENLSERVVMPGQQSNRLLPVYGAASLAGHLALPGQCSQFAKSCPGRFVWVLRPTWCRSSSCLATIETYVLAYKLCISVVCANMLICPSVLFFGTPRGFLAADVHSIVRLAEGEEEEGDADALANEIRYMRKDHSYRDSQD